MADSDQPNPTIEPTQPATDVVVSGGEAQPAVTEPVPAIAEPAQPPTADMSAQPAQPTEPSENGQGGESVTWTASEFVAHNKSVGWYAMLILGSVLVAAIIFFLTRDLVSGGVVIIAGLLLAVYGSHKPRQVQYVIDRRGVGVGQRRHSYDEFRSFSVVSEGAFSGLVLMPLKRFALPLTMYYAPADEDRILGMLSDQLPLEEHRPDAIDTLLRRIRF